MPSPFDNQIVELTSTLKVNVSRIIIYYYRILEF